MNHDILKFIDSPDVREFNKNTVFTPAQQVILVSRSEKTTVFEKIEMLEYLLNTYTEEEFGEDSIIFDCMWNRCMSFYENTKHMVRMWKDILADREVQDGSIYVARFEEREFFYERGDEEHYFSSYENAYAYIKEEKEEYLDIEKDHGKPIPMVGFIERVVLDEDVCDIYWFDNDLNLVKVFGREERYALSEEVRIEPFDHFIFHLPLPFHVGDILKMETLKNEPVYGVVYYEWNEPKNPVLVSMNMWLDCYWEEKKKYDFMDDAPILSLTYATDEDLKTLSEEESYKLRLLSKARKKEIDFYELLLDRNIPI